MAKFSLGKNYTRKSYDNDYYTQVKTIFNSCDVKV
jgi:hypothetical protein